MPAHDPSGADGADDPSPDPALGTPLPHPHSFPGVLANYGLSEDDGLQGLRRPDALAAALARMRAYQTDEAHIRAYAKLVGITPEQAARMLDAFFEGAIERLAVDALKGIHVRDAILARHAECTHDGLCDVIGAGFNKIEAENLPCQPICICLVVWLSLSAEALTQVPKYRCHLIDPHEDDVVEIGIANVETVFRSESVGSDTLSRAMVIVRVGAPVLMHEGDYVCRLSIDDQHIASVPFTVALPEASRQHVALAS